jgi:uncharacterized SAM-dependent methyltransferase
VADTVQTVKLGRLGLTVRFQPGDDIWTENSYKFARRVEAMLGGASLGLAVAWTRELRGARAG